MCAVLTMSMIQGFSRAGWAWLYEGLLPPCMSALLVCQACKMTNKEPCKPERHSTPDTLTPGDVPQSFVSCTA
jgi:hypothetical protein